MIFKYGRLKWLPLYLASPSDFAKTAVIGQIFFSAINNGNLYMQRDQVKISITIRRPPFFYGALFYGKKKAIQ
jgi:hypothetical protein